MGHVAHIKRLATLYVIMGMVYFTSEGFWRGWTNIAMFFIGGFCGVLIGLLNQSKRHKQLKLWQQCLIGTIIILTVEFTTGCIFNLWLGWGLWSYSGEPLNLYDQICLPYAGLWFLLTPTAIWLDDWLRWKLYREKKSVKLILIYKMLFRELLVLFKPIFFTILERSKWYGGRDNTKRMH